MKTFFLKLTLTLIASLGYFIIGLSRIVSNPTITGLDAAVSLSKMALSENLVTIINPVGAFAGSFLGGLMTHVFGRKR